MFTCINEEKCKKLLEDYKNKVVVAKVACDGRIECPIYNSFQIIKYERLLQRLYSGEDKLNQPNPAILSKKGNL